MVKALHNGPCKTTLASLSRRRKQRLELSQPTVPSLQPQPQSPSNLDITFFTSHFSSFNAFISIMASLHFCSECNNLLYPKADPQRRVMIYACRICDFDESGENKCVYRNDLLVVTKEQKGITTDLGADPTLAHSNIECPQCQHQDAVFYQDQSKRKETRMILFYVCTKCGHSFTDPTLALDDQGLEA